MVGSDTIVIPSGVEYIHLVVVNEVGTIFSPSSSILMHLVTVMLVPGTVYLSAFTPMHTVDSAVSVPIVLPAGLVSMQVCETNSMP